MEKILKLTSIQVDNGLNPREGVLDQEAITEYAAHTEALPKMHAFEIEGSYYLTRGFHRFAAHQLAGVDEALFEVHEGTWEEAQEDADLDNLQHGLRLTRVEKRAVIGRQLKRHPERSDVWLARQCHTTDKTVRNVREGLEEASEIPRLETLTGSDGVERPRSVERPAKMEPLPEPKVEPAQESEPEWLEDDGFVNGAEEQGSKGAGERIEKPAAKSKPESPPPPPPLPPLPPPVITESKELNISVRVKEDGSVVVMATRGGTMLAVPPEIQAEFGALVRRLIGEEIEMEVAA